MRNDPALAEAFAADAQSGLKTGAVGWLVEGGLIIGGIRTPSTATSFPAVYSGPRPPPWM
jgi:hypothetical protein